MSDLRAAVVALGDYITLLQQRIAELENELRLRSIGNPPPGWPATDPWPPAEMVRG